MAKQQDSDYPQEGKGGLFKNDYKVYCNNVKEGSVDNWGCLGTGAHSATRYPFCYGVEAEQCGRVRSQHVGAAVVCVWMFRKVLEFIGPCAGHSERAAAIGDGGCIGDWCWSRAYAPFAGFGQHGIRLYGIVCSAEGNLL